jgi:putative nucleotidyltransferase-like protein
MEEATLRSWLAVLPEDSASFEAMVRSLSTDRWSALLDAALVHGVFGVIGRHLNPSLVPKPVWDSFIYRRTILNATQDSVIAALEATLSSFAAAGVRICALKGPALSARLYGDPSVRASIDLDLLIEPGDLDRAVALMNDLGYAGKSDTTVAYLLRHGHHLHFAKGGTTSVEVHFQAYAGFGVTVPSAALMDRAIEYRFSDRTRVLIPSPEDEFMYLAAHASGHSFARLLWPYDLKMFVIKHPHLDWDQIASRSRQARISVAVGFAVRVLRQWFHLPLGGVIARFPPSGIRLAVARSMLSIASGEMSASALHNFKGLVFTAMLCDRPRSTAWLLQHHILRSLRRRAHRTAPRMLPQSWSG